MERGNLLSKIKKQYGNVYDDNKNRHLHAVSNPIEPNNWQFSVVELKQIIRQLSLRSAIETELFVESLYKIAQFDNTNHEIIKRRAKFLKETAPFMVHSLNKIITIGIKNTEQGAFLLDNITTINKIMTLKRIAEYDQLEIFKILDKKNYNEFLEIAESKHCGTKLVTEFIYKQRPHEIKFGETLVLVDSSEIISFLTGITSLSFSKSSSHAKSNETLKNLIIKNYWNDSITPSEIVEGILTQKPILTKIAKKYIQLNAKWNTWLNDNDDVIRKQEQFFETLANQGILDKEIELKQMIPDKNALPNPQQTLELLYEKLNS